ncbi:hypothetical protein RRG08_067071 [Elysia crispata]|uniref:Uncharacterized protein n=1 Tax=Elysia crispata TaxID=231223 RepID=A0AAE1ECT5_9GAST|nr:hypothetical protein RRG08_067071 [Elysia crispata]
MSFQNPIHKRNSDTSNRSPQGWTGPSSSPTKCYTQSSAFAVRASPMSARWLGLSYCIIRLARVGPRVAAI